MQILLQSSDACNNNNLQTVACTRLALKLIKHPYPSEIDRYGLSIW